MGIMFSGQTNPTADALRWLVEMFFFGVPKGS